MITIYYGDRKETKKPLLEHIPDVFRISYKPRWLEDPLAVQVLEGIEQVKVESPYCFKHYAYGQISPYMLSSGVKHLLLMMSTDILRNKYMFDCAFFGDNCVPYIQRIGDKYNLDIFVDRFLNWDDAYMKDHPIMSAFSNKYLYSDEEAMDDQLDWEEFIDPCD